MKDWYQKLKIEYQIVFWSLLSLAVIMLATIPCYFFGYMDIPLGISLGMGISILIYLFLGIFNNPNKQKRSFAISILILSIRLLIIGGVAFLDGWLYYQKQIRIFNIFGLLGGYLIPVVINLIIAARRKE